MIDSLLPLRSILVTLQWLTSSRLNFLHNVPLNAWVRNLVGSPADFSSNIVVEPLENGHTHYSPNAQYRFRITCLKGGELILEQILIGLQQLPGSVPDRAKGKKPFSTNLELISVQDSFTRQSITKVDELSLFDQQALWKETAIWAKHTYCQLVFTSPVRLTFDKLLTDDNNQHSIVESKKIKGKQRYCRDQDHFTWSLLTQRISDTLINLVGTRTGNRQQRQAWPPAQVNNCVAFWVSYEYDTNENDTAKDASGTLASLQIQLPANFPEKFLTWLVLGQYLGIGERRSAGMGQYQLIDQYQQTTYTRPGASVSLLQQALEDSSLEKACNTMYTRRAEYDGEDTEDDHHKSKMNLLQRLREQRQHILQHNYTPTPLQPLLIDKPNGDSRLLSIPSWRDRTLQRAVTDLLAPALDKLWMKHSYGYRRGHSRQNARDQINRYIQQGYEWILESDIASFFDSVSWSNIHQRLNLLLPNEPLVDLIMQWVRCESATSDDKTNTSVPRTKGLPQGASISPVLANLLLDDLDQDMLAQGYRIIRFADDFVLLFKTQTEAEAALPKVRESLQEHGLTINEDKTRIVSSQTGFRYLGYLFIDGYAIESNRAYRKEEKEIAVANKPHRQTPNNKHIGERENWGTLLIIAGDLAMLFSEAKRLVVEQYDTRNSYPWNNLSAVLLIGPHQITTPAARTAMQEGVPIHFANNFGRYQGVMASQEPSHLGANFWLMQISHLQHESSALAISKELVSARLSGQHALIYRRDKNASELDKLHRIASKIQQANDLDQLRGYEGQAAKLLWAFFQRHLDTQWQFKNRNRRPPKDPVNAMLSLGYSFLYGVIDSVNRSVGLYPWQGAYHQGRGKHKTLASDLMEPYRVLVERVILTLINRGQVKPDHFATTEQGCQMSSEARKALLQALLVQLTNKHKDRTNLMDSMKEQAYSLALSCKTGQRFSAWRSK